MAFKVFAGLLHEELVYLVVRNNFNAPFPGFSTFFGFLHRLVGPLLEIIIHMRSLKQQVTSVYH